MEVEKTGTTYKCPKCKYKWDWEDTHCPNCGSDDFTEEEIHLGDNWRERGENANTGGSKCAIQRVSNNEERVAVCHNKTRHLCEGKDYPKFCKGCTEFY